MQGFLATETDKFSNIIAMQVFNMDRLRQLVAFENNLQSTYGALLNDTLFSEFNGRREQLRRQLLIANKAHIEQNIQRATSVAEIDQIIANHTMPSDLTLAEALSINTAKESRLAVIAPFYKMPDGDYFNAIFQGDVNTVRSLDRYYLASLKPLIDQSNANTQRMLSVIEVFSGGSIPANSLSKLFEISLEKLTLVKPVSAIYLFNYQTLYARCLRSNAKHFDVTTTTPDVVTRNMLGIEISRIYGSSSRKEYEVNDEFSDIFWRIGASNPESLGAVFMDGMFNGSKISTLMQSTKTLMRSYDCNSPTMKTFEKNLITLFNQLD